MNLFRDLRIMKYVRQILEVPELKARAVYESPVLSNLCKLLLSDNNYQDYNFYPSKLLLFLSNQPMFHPYIHQYPYNRK